MWASQVLRGDEANRQEELPAYWVANVGASARLRGLETFVRLNNVLDDRHATFAPSRSTAASPASRCSAS